MKYNYWALALHWVLGLSGIPLGFLLWRWMDRWGNRFTEKDNEQPERAAE